MKIGDRVFVRGYIDEIRKDTVIVRNDGGYFGTILSEIITGELPSAQPERKTGKWIHGRDGWECSGCRCLVEEENKPPYNFCPQCGTYVRGDET